MGFEPHDLRVMSPTSYQTALLRDMILCAPLFVCLYIISHFLPLVKPFFRFILCFLFYSFVFCIITLIFHFFVTWSCLTSESFVCYIYIILRSFPIYSSAFAFVAFDPFFYYIRVFAVPFRYTYCCPKKSYHHLLHFYYIFRDLNFLFSQ